VRLSRALAGIARLVLAQDCVLCRAPSGDAPVCAGCAADLPRIPEACPRCALPSPGGRLCGACIVHPPAFDATVAAWRYADQAAALVHAFKYGGRLALAGFLAHALAARIGPLPAVDAIVPMPLAPERLAGRGFNQSVEVARLLAPPLRVPLAVHAARRVRGTADQTGLDAEARRANVRGAFAVVADVRGRSVALVDDVMTTGATLNELAGTLKRAGATRVDNWVVARTVRDV
jgi:ComF family protein